MSFKGVFFSVFSSDIHFVSADQVIAAKEMPFKGVFFSIFSSNIHF